MKRRFALTIIGIGFLLAAGLGYVDYSSLGFPDGYLSAFELETRDLRFAAIIANVTLGVLVCACGLSWIRSPSRAPAGGGGRLRRDRDPEHDAAVMP